MKQRSTGGHLLCGRGKDTSYLAPPATDPYVKNYLIRLLLRVFGVETLIWVGMQNPGLWYPVLDYTFKPFPGHSVPLASTPKRMEPVAGHLFTESIETDCIAGYCMVIKIPLHYASEPASEHWDREMAASH